MAKKKCECKCSGGMITAHILVLLGAFFMTWGLITLGGGTAGVGAVLKSAFFWGFILLLAGKCCAHKMKDK